MRESQQTSTLRLASDDDIGDLSAAARLWEAVRGQPGIGYVLAGKLLARKRPRLIPVLHSVVKAVLRHSGTGYWLDLRDHLRADNGRLRDALDSARDRAALYDDVSTIRTFDVLVWLTGKGVEPQRWLP